MLAPPPHVLPPPRACWLPDFASWAGHSYGTVVPAQLQGQQGITKAQSNSRRRRIPRAYGSPPWSPPPAGLPKLFPRARSRDGVRCACRSRRVGGAFSVRAAGLGLGYKSGDNSSRERCCRWYIIGLLRCSYMRIPIEINVPPSPTHVLHQLVHPCHQPRARRHPTQDALRSAPTSRETVRPSRAVVPVLA